MACGSKVVIELQNLFDTRFGIKNSRHIGRCGTCGNEQTIPFPSSGDLKQLYETYYNFGGEKGTFYTGLRARLFSSIRYLFWLNIDGDISFHTQKGADRLLDVGCNEGRGLRIYARNGFYAEGFELNERAAAETRHAGFRVYTCPLNDSAGIRYRECKTKQHPENPVNPV